MAAQHQAQSAPQGVGDPPKVLHCLQCLHRLGLLLLQQPLGLWGLACLLLMLVLLLGLWWVLRHCR
jgi:hypothetical protein